MSPESSLWLSFSQPTDGNMERRVESRDVFLTEKTSPLHKETWKYEETNFGHAASKTALRMNGHSVMLSPA